MSVCGCRRFYFYFGFGWNAQLGKKASGRTTKTNEWTKKCVHVLENIKFVFFASIYFGSLRVCVYYYCLYTFVHISTTTKRTQSGTHSTRSISIHSLSSFSWWNNGGQASKAINVLKRHAVYANDGKQKRKKTSVLYIDIFETQDCRAPSSESPLTILIEYFSFGVLFCRECLSILQPKGLTCRCVGANVLVLKFL